MNLTTITLALSLSLVANDNATAPVCVACNERAQMNADVALCTVCDEDMRVHTTEEFVPCDDEGELFSKGFDTDPRF